jgi:hypothetical protein
MIATILTAIISILVLAVWLGCIWVDVIKGGKKCK